MYAQYLDRYRQIEHQIEQVLEKESGSLRSFIVSICVQRYLPNYTSQSDIDLLIKGVMINQALAWEEQNDLSILNKIYATGEITNTPTIFVAFHLSSYRLGFFYLLTKGIPISVIASEDVIQQQFAQLDIVHRNITGESITLIDANASNSLYTIRQHLKAGRSLFVYLDGNTGSDGMNSANKNLFEVNFLASSIMVRKGIPTISYLCNVGMTPILCKRDAVNNLPCIIIGDSIKPMDSENRNEYVNRALESLYSLLEQYVLETPDSWEAWLYMYKFATRKPI